MITNNDPVMNEAMVCVQEACAVALDRCIRQGVEDKEFVETWAVIRVRLSPVYGDTDLKVTVHGPFKNEWAAMARAQRLGGRTFVFGPVEAT